VEACVFILMVAFQPAATIQVVVTASGQPVAGAQVIVGGVATTTMRDGAATIRVSVGVVEMTVFKEGFNPVTVTATARVDAEAVIAVELERQTAIEEHVTVSATRSDKRVEDQAMRVEVLGAEEIEEKQLMTPGDIVMMLNEMGGMRVQATSPSLGAASVRVQGMRGRYTRFLSDGLPLYGDVGGLGLLQIPPSDLGQVEVIKGVASALYGAGALGGVVDLISRRPGPTAARDALVNRTTRGGTDAVLFAAQPFSERWRGTLLVGGHWQTKNDVDEDGWADLAGYSRAIIRPRVFWNDDAGRSMFFTSGLTWERRTGGTVTGRVLAPTGSPFIESLDTMRVDGGLVAQAPIAGRYVLTTRLSANHHRGDHGIGDVHEHDVRGTFFGEAAVRGSAPRQTWVAGAAVERATLASRIRPDFDYTYIVPGLFVQDDAEVTRWLVVSASARIDAHNRFGTFASPRVSTLVRGRGWNGRLSIGSGFFAPSALTEETEAAGLARLRVPASLRAERGRSTSLDITRTHGSVSITTTLFRYDVRDPAVVDRRDYTLTNLPERTITAGFEAVATLRRAPFSVTSTYTYVHSREGFGTERGEVPLTPRHSAGLVAMWEREGRGRAGFEAYFTGRQRLEDNPFRQRSAAYVLFGGLLERHVGRFRLFANVENLADVRQTDWDPLIRQTRAADGRWTVDAWAPLDGRVLNGGVRIAF
jgi:outer membrane receptor for ferrienterochelin and colicins